MTTGRPRTINLRRAGVCFRLFAFACFSLVHFFALGIEENLRLNTMLVEQNVSFQLSKRGKPKNLEKDENLIYRVTTE